MRAILSIAIILAVSTMNARAQSLEQQAICAKQAKIAFEENKADNELQLKIGQISGDYRSHYNPKLNKCLVLIERTVETGGGEFSTSSQLMDVFERRIFGTYSWTSKDTNYQEVPPAGCVLTPTSWGIILCSSKEAFDAFVSKYMEDDESEAK